MYRAVYSKQAVRTLARLPRNLAVRIRDKVLEVARDPYADHPNVTKLQGRTGYRLRVGDWRVLYEVQNDQLVVLVLDIGPRGQIYR